MIFVSVIYGIWIATCIVALVQGVLLGLNTWEHRRFAHRRIIDRRPVSQTYHVALLAPCKGLDLQMESNLRQLLCQDYDHYEVVFVVESIADPAFPIIQKLIQLHSRIPARIMIAGQATTTGQKIHNLITATSQLSPQVEILAFVDSDICPTSDWLGRLVTRLHRPNCGAVTGYRWFVPTRTSLMNCLLYSINSSIAALLGSGGQYIVWGGSWAIRRSDFEALGIRERWQGTISDDLIATLALKEAELPIEFEPVCMTASPVDYSLLGLTSFLRRQHLIGRIYAPKIWYQSLWLMVISSIAVAGAIGATVYGVTTSANWSRWPACFLLAWYALQIYRGWLRCGLARLYVRQWSRPLIWAALFDVLGTPLTLLYNTAVMCGACHGSRIHWRGIVYDLDQQGRLIRVLSPTAQPVPTDRNLRFDIPGQGPLRPGNNHTDRPVSFPNSQRAAGE